MSYNRSNHKEASTGKYIGVWVLSGIIVRIATLAVETAMTMYVRSNRLGYEDIFGVVLVTSVISTIVAIAVFISIYSYFKDLNLKKVVPYVYVLGGLGIVWGFIMNLGSYSLFGHSSDAAFIAALISSLIGVGGLIYIGHKFNTIEDIRIRSRISQDKRNSSNYSKPNQTQPPTHKTNIKTPAATSITPHPAPKANRQPNVMDMLKNYPQAETRIEYVTEIGDAWLSISELPDKYKLIFLQSVEDNSHTSIDALIGSIKASYSEESRRFKDTSMNSAYEKAIELGEEYANEFEKVADLLADILQPNEILDKVKSKVEKNAAPPEMIPLHKFLAQNSMTQMVREPEKYRIFVREEEHPAIPNVKNYYILQDEIEHKLLGFTELSRFLRELNN